ncbi:MAG TPA: hypothetical protein PKA85_06395 [Ferruginibacter sp.]|nr:hypothetical protein [Ferruginibacter sp.]
MFKMTCDIKFEGYKPTKASSLTWQHSVDNICSTAKIVIPTMSLVTNKEKEHSFVDTALVITEGMKVEIYAGYDGKNDLQFSGFVSRINFKTPLELECEGYSYQLKRKIINKSFGRTTVRDVLNYLIEGTDIKLSAKMPDKIVFEPCTFKNYTAIQVLEWLKEKYLLTVFFEDRDLYVGWLATYKGGTVKHRLNWNVIKDDSLVFNTSKGAIVQIQAESRAESGERKKKKSQNVAKPGNVKRVTVEIQDEADKQMAVNDMQQRANQRGYTGKITGFLKPFVRPGMTTELIDNKYRDRNGKYFVESVSGNFTSSGGRQTIEIGGSLST